MVALVLFAVAVLVRLAAGALYIDPAYPDSYYYVSVARALAAGDGFSVDYVWSYMDVGGTLPAAGVLPIPSNAHWMPLAAIVQVPFIWLLGPTALASALPFWLVGAAAAPLTWLIGRDAGLDAGIALTGALLVAAPAAVLPFMAQPDNFGLFMTLGALALWLCTRAARGERWAFAVGGLVVGLAMLSRNDGVLLGVPFALVALRGLTDATRRRASATGAVICMIAFAIVAAPWVARQLTEFGSVSPSAASGRTLWATDYRDLLGAGPPPTLESFLAQGPAVIVGSRVEGLVAALAIFALQPLALVLAPLALVGGWHLRRSRAFEPFLVYAFVLFATVSVLFAAHVAHGMFLHSAVALLPHTFLLVGAGLWRAIDWMAARRASWRPGQARSVFGAGVIGVALLAGGFQTAATHGSWRAAAETRHALDAAPATDQIAPTDVVMSADPGALHYLRGWSGVVTPDDPLAVIEEAARRYGVRWLVLERRQIVPALQPVLLGTLQPAWLSAPVAIVDGGIARPGPNARIATSTPTAISVVVPDLALYAVCLEPADARCPR